MSDALLDNEQDPLLNAQDSDILWQGKPDRSILAILLGLGSYHGMLLGVTIVVPLLIYMSSGILLPFSVWIVAFLLFTIPIYFKIRQQKRVEYYVLKTGVYLKKLNWRWQPKTIFIPIENIVRINIQPFNKKVGYLMIYTKNSPDYFRTKDPQSFVLVEMVPDIKTVALLIQKQL